MEVATCLLAHLILANPLFAQNCLFFLNMEQITSKMQTKCASMIVRLCDKCAMPSENPTKILLRSGASNDWFDGFPLFENLTHCHSLLPRWKWPVEDYARSGGRQATNSNFGFCNCEFPLFQYFQQSSPCWYLVNFTTLCEWSAVNSCATVLGALNVNPP